MHGSVPRALATGVLPSNTSFWWKAAPCLCIVARGADSNAALGTFLEAVVLI